MLQGHLHAPGSTAAVPVQGGDLLDWTSNNGIQEDAFIHRMEALSTMGYSVMLSNFRRFFSLAAYISVFTHESIVLAMGIPSLTVRPPLPSRLRPAFGGWQDWCSFLWGASLHERGEAYSVLPAWCNVPAGQARIFASSNGLPCDSCRGCLTRASTLT